MKDIEMIVRNYGALLESLGTKQGLLFPMSLLPYPKEDIRAALIRAIEITTDKQIKGALETCLSCLADFIPDEEVPSDRMENVREWARRQKQDLGE